MSTEDLFAALGDSFQLAEEDGDLSVGSFGDNDNNLDFSGELVFAELGKEDNNPSRSPHQTEATNSGEGNKSQSTSNHGSNHGSMSSIPGGTGLAMGLPPPPSMMSSMNNSMSNTMNSPFRGPATGTSSAALQNAAATIQGSSRFAFAQQQHSGSNSNNAFMSQPQHQFRSNNQGVTNNNMSSNSMNNSMNRSNSMNASMQMNRGSSMQSSMMNNNSTNNGSMGNASFNSPMPPPSRPPMTTPSMTSNSMFKNNFGNNNNQQQQQQQQQQTPNLFFQQTNPNSSNWNDGLEKPKRPLSAFEFFVQERKRMVALTDAQLQVIWKDQLDLQQKNIYLQQSRADRQRYITELKLWKARTERSQPAGALGNFLKARLQGSKTDLQQVVEANKRGRLQPAIVSCPNLNVSPSARLQAMQQQQMGYQGGGGQNATFDNFQQPIQHHPQGNARPMSRFVANQMQRLQQGQGLADLASELGDDCTTAFVSAMMPRSQSASVVQHGSHGLRFKQQQSSPNMQQDPNLMDPLMEFHGF